MDSQYSPTAITLFIVRGLLFCICLYAAIPYSDNTNVARSNLRYGNLKFSFLSYFSLSFTLLTFIVGLIYRIKKKLFKLYNILIPFCFTLELIVTVLFWTLFFIKPDLINNSENRSEEFKTPVIRELGQHLFPFILVILEQLDIKIEKSSISGAVMVSTCVLWYLALSKVAEINENRHPLSLRDKVNDLCIRYALFSLFLLISLTIQSFYVYVKTRENR